MITSLYIHIPFCTQKCAYCDFFSVPLASGKHPLPDENYVNAVLNEVEFYVKKYNVTGWHTIYVGGGTPSRLGEKLLSKLIKSVKEKASCSQLKEVTVEVNPEDVNEELIAGVKNAGVTRISMGIQCLDDKALKIINRKSNRLVALKALEILKNNWSGKLSVDFIAGLPGQTYRSFENQFEVIKDYNPDHISLYTLTVEEKTPLFRMIETGKIRWNLDKADKMWLKGAVILKKMGFKQYEISNFAKEGFESIHNQVYWNLDNYLGAGSGASGTVYGSTSLRWTNTADIKKYEEFWLNNEIDKEIGLKEVQEHEIIDFNTQEFEYLMMGLRLRKGISAQKYKLRFNRDLEERLEGKQKLFSEWKNKKRAQIVQKNGESFYRLTEKGIMFLNQFLESLL